MSIKEPTVSTLSKEFVQPEGYPSTDVINQRVASAANRLSVRGAQIPMNPLVTEFTLRALLKVLARKGLIDQKDCDEIAYFTAFIQMQFLEDIIEKAPRPTLLIPQTRGAMS